MSLGPSCSLSLSLYLSLSHTIFLNVLSSFELTYFYSSNMNAAIHTCGRDFGQSPVWMDTRAQLVLHFPPRLPRVRQQTETDIKRHHCQGANRQPHFLLRQIASVSFDNKNKPTAQPEIPAPCSHPISPDSRAACCGEELEPRRCRTPRQISRDPHGHFLEARNVGRMKAECCCKKSEQTP